MRLEAKRVSIRRRGQVVVDTVTMEARPGEVFALLGPNGAGKSTLLKAMVGVLPYEGSIQVEGQEISALSAAERARKIAYVPQRSMLRMELTVSEVVQLGRYSLNNLFRRNGDQVEHSVQSAIEEFDLTDLRKRFFTELSMGEQQRVLMARAWVSEAQVLLLDEPAASLDVGEALAIFKRIRRLSESGKTIIIVIHDLAVAREVAHQALLIRQGQSVAFGKTSDVVTSENVRKVYDVHLVEKSRLGYQETSENSRVQGG